jgi:hypothetical protein
LTRKPHTKKSRAAEFISRRLNELRGRKTQGDVARIAGFANANMISLIAGDKAKLPVERAVALARALECDPAILVRLALEQSLSEPLMKQIFAHQTVSEGLDDLLSPAAPARRSHSIPSLEVTNVAMRVQVGLALHQLRALKQFATHVSARADRLGDYLEGMRSGLDEMIRPPPV